MPDEEPLRVGGAAKEGLIHGGARHCCPNSAWYGARRKWMNSHDQRATKPSCIRAATRRAFLASLERSDADFHSIPFQVAWRVEQLIRPFLKEKMRVGGRYKSATTTRRPRYSACSTGRKSSRSTGNGSRNNWRPTTPSSSRAKWTQGGSLAPSRPAVLSMPATLKASASGRSAPSFFMHRIRAALEQRRGGPPLPGL